MIEEKKYRFTPPTIENMPTLVIEHQLFPKLSSKDISIFSQINKHFSRLSTAELKHRVFAKAVSERSISRITTLFDDGYIPKNPNTLMELEYFEVPRQYTPLQFVFLAMSNYPNCVEIADRLLAAGATLPTIADTTEFNALIYKKFDLYCALREDPHIIYRQGSEDGRTLLHWGATIGNILSAKSCSLILNLLTGSPYVDYSLQDHEGDTALHIAVQYCQDRETYQTVFPFLVKKAAEHSAQGRFNFSTLNNRGQAVLHLAVRTSYDDSILGSRENIGHLLVVPGIDLNVLSSSGSTPFYYAVNHLRFTEANLLLDAGADPTICGEDDRDPFKMIQEHIDTHKKFLDCPELLPKNDEDGFEVDDEKLKFAQITRLEQQLESLSKLQKRMILVREKNKSPLSVLMQKSDADEVDLESDSKPFRGIR